MKNRQFIVLLIVMVIGFGLIWYQNIKLHEQTDKWVEGVMLTTTDQYARIINNISDIKKELGI